VSPHPTDPPVAGRGRREVVVGVDGSDLALHAVGWAAAEARLRGVPLRVVHAAPGGPAGSDPRRPREILARAFAVARQAEPEVVVSTGWTGTDPVPALLAGAAGAALLVVGMGGADGQVLVGSVALEVSGRATCPVVVVRGGPGPPQGPVLVGVDTVDGDAAALTVAFADARRHGGRVEVLHARYVTDPLSPPAAEHATDVAARARLHDELAPRIARSPEVPVEVTVVHDIPAVALLRAAEGSRLVVVGTRADGVYARALFGSTSREVLRRSPVTVTVVGPDAVVDEPDAATRTAPAPRNSAQPAQ
jgi:nucleotide-binding universal stress UspA family protein